MQHFLKTPEDTVILGEALAHTRPPLAVIYLRGDLGAGKSTLARALLRGLGVEGSIRSPTYTLVERYSIADGEAWHLDLYRMGDASELDFLGLDEAVATLWLIEWPERVHGGLPAPDVEIYFSLLGDGRDVRLVASTDIGRDWLVRLKTHVS